MPNLLRTLQFAILVWVFCLLLHLSSAFAQSSLEGRLAGGGGRLRISNYEPGWGIDAQVTFLDGSPVGGGYIAQLYGGPAGTPIADLAPCFPTTTFRTDAGQGYLNREEVVVPGVSIQDKATVQLRVFDGQTWETSLCRGESNVLTVLTGGGLSVIPPLVGLEPFHVVCVPEPRAITLFAMSVLCAIFARRRG